MSKIDDGKVKKSDLKKKKSKSPSKVEPASPKAKKNWLVDSCKVLFSKQSSL